MAVSATQSVRVLDTETAPADGDTIPSVESPKRYEAAEEADLKRFESSYSFPRFVTTVLGELGREYESDELRLADAIDEPDDVEFGALLVGPDELLLFVGSDPTAKDAIPWFAFGLEPTRPVPGPDTAQAALNLLKTPDVLDVEQSDDWLPPRHGEWWLLPTDLMPGGTVFKPGVSRQPYGPSPLGNHVPREYAFAVTDAVFMERFAERFDPPGSIRTVPEAIEWFDRQLDRPTVDGLSWAQIRDLADEVIVRGSLRHRESDHYVEQLGETWHRAQTHDFEVWTGDDVAGRVHLDYHGL